MQIAVYGSLKKGYYNHPIIEGAEFIGEDTVRGYMTLVYSYPQLMLDPSENEHTIEIYNVSQEQFESCHYMEIGAGYSERKIMTKYGEAIIWVFTDKAKMSGHQIKAYNRDEINSL